MPKKSDSEYWLDQPVSGRGGFIATAIILCQHLVLWGSIYVFATAVYTIRTPLASPIVIGCDALIMLTALISILVIIGQHAESTLCACIDLERQKMLDGAARTSRWALPTVALFWLVNCGIVALALALFKGQQLCGLAPLSPANPPGNGVVCKLQLGNAIASVPLFITTSLLYLLKYHVAQDPFAYNLCGMKKRHGLHPAQLAYMTSTERPNYSAMSFKCRSSTSLSSLTLAPLPNDSTTDLLPTTSEKAGLGIFTTKPTNTRSSFLTPRPSLSSIRSSTKLVSIPPPSSPLPPLPPYLPKHRLHRGDMRRYRAIPPPQKSRQREERKTKDTVRIVPPSPAPNFGNLARNTSQDSLSSVYSQAVTGERYSVSMSGHRRDMTGGSRNFSSGSVVTVRRSPLGGMMRLAEYPGIVSVLEKDAIASSADIDDTATLEARLSSLNKGSGRLGDDWPALVIPKTRERAMAQPQGIVYGIAV